MTPGARFNTVIELYDMIAATPKPADQILFQYFRQRKFIGSKDRKFITETIYTLLRYYGRLTWWAKYLGTRDDGRLITLLWLLLTTSYAKNDIHDIFSGAGYSPDTLSRFERDVMDKVFGKDIEHPEMPEAALLECPEWAYDSLKKYFGTRLKTEMLAMQEEAPLDIRVNTLKSTREAVLKQLRRDDFDVVETDYSPFGLRVEGRPAFSTNALYQNGSIEIQDEGSQLLTLLCGVRPGEWVVDFCAGAGGKTLALAAQMNNKGRIWACDVEQRRLDNNRLRLRRAGVHCVEMRLLKDEEDGWVGKHQAKADCVMIDAPCSGVGTWRRNPFMRWQSAGKSLKTLLDLQQNILRSASRLVKPGGRLIYATCSMLPEENQKQVEAFLADNPQFKPIPLKEMWQASVGEQLPSLDLAESSLQLTPAMNKTDGFFVSAMQRR